jgi:hypothetical protein
MPMLPKWENTQPHSQSWHHMFKSQYRNPRITTKQGNVTSQKIYFTKKDYKNGQRNQNRHEKIE